jgi:predicted dehydrogenase
MKASGITELVGVASASGVSARSVATRFGFRYCASDENELLSDPAINTIVIVTRHDLHARQIIAALSAGKHVFCEKPLCLNQQELAQIAAAYSKTRTSDLRPRLMVGFNRRFAPPVRRMRDFVCSIAEPLVMNYRVNAGYIPPHHWTQDPKQGGGRIIGELCHFVDLLCYLTGSRVTSVQSTALPNNGRYCDDNLIVTLAFEGGSIGIITYVSNGDKSFSKERIEVFGGGVITVLDDFRCLELTRGGRRQTFRSRLQQDKGHRSEWESFTKSICQGLPTPILLEDIVHTTEITFQIVKSLRSYV